MGMAASQARYLGLAARKTNCEYQGQQINQARTALGNQSAELWNQMLGLSVPTAPDTTNYTKTQYSFSDGQNDYEITSMVPTDEEDGYNYSIKYKYYAQEIKGIENTNTNPQVQNVYTDTSEKAQMTATGDPVVVKIGGVTVTATDKLDPNDADDKKTLDKLVKAGIITNTTDSVYAYLDGTETKYYAGTIPTAAQADSQIDIHNLNEGFKVGNATTKLVDTNDAATITALDKIQVDNPTTKLAAAIEAGNYQDIFTYEKNGTTYYACREDLSTSANGSTSKPVDSTIDNQPSLKQYYTSQIKTEKVASDYALMDDASGSGRFTSIQLQKYNGTTFGLNTETTSNDAEYQNALNQYYYDTQQYEKTLADINAKTELIQNEDRTLELRLKQLDTEHNALQTEMEAVKKVITKNVEDTFKTFGG